MRSYSVGLVIVASLLGSMPAHAERLLYIEAVERSNDRWDQTGQMDISGLAVDRMEDLGIDIDGGGFYCAVSPPGGLRSEARFMRVNGQFYMLNGTSQTLRAVIDATGQRHQILDPREALPVVGSDPALMQSLIDGASWAC